MRLNHTYSLNITAMALLALAAMTLPAVAACPDDPAKAVAVAKQAITERADTAAAVICLIAAVETLNNNLNDLIAGKTIIEGTMTTRDGFAIQADKPTTKEGR